MITFEEGMQIFKEDNEFRMEKETLKAYEAHVKELLAHSQKSFHEITQKDIRRWQLYLEKKGNKRKTVNTKFHGVKTYYTYCLEEKSINLNPVASIEIPSIGEWLPTI